MNNQNRVHEVDLDYKTYHGELRNGLDYWKGGEITEESPQQIEDGRDLYQELHGDAPDPRFQNYDIAMDFYYEGRQVVREQVRIVCPVQGHRSLPPGYICEFVLDQTRSFVDKCKMDSVLESEMADVR
ncbi:predicted protein [Chaetoceros tenuissimus]|uniref:Uncharacterized protein n=1 Tax=Chaetoceros tenuissimus TaxID=426638 RepID=A0AAD3D4P9_9STRA|nr:predicted protein [Chaetoceros tenuissimus]